MTLQEALRQKNTNSIRNALLVSENNRAIDTAVGLEFANRTQAVQTGLLNSAANLLRDEANNPLSDENREILRTYTENPSDGKAFFGALRLIEGKDGAIRALNDMGYTAGATGNNALALGDFNIESGVIAPTFISRDYDREQVVSAPFTAGGKKFSDGAEPLVVPIESFENSLTQYIRNINSYVDRNPLGTNPGQSLASGYRPVRAGGILQPSDLVQKILSGEKTDLTEQELKEAQNDPYVQKLIADTETPVDEAGKLNSFTPDSNVSAQNRKNIEQSNLIQPDSTTVDTGDLEGTALYKAFKFDPSGRTGASLPADSMYIPGVIPYGISAEKFATLSATEQKDLIQQQKVFSLRTIGDNVRDKLREIGIDNLDDETKAFYEKFGGLRKLQTQRSQLVVESPTTKPGGFKQDRPLGNALLNSDVYRQEFENDPVAFAKKYANDPEFLKNSPSKKEQTTTRIKANKGFANETELVDFLRANTDGNTGIMDVGYLSDKAKYNIAYAAQVAAKKDGILSSTAFSDSLLNLIDYGIFTTGASAGMDSDYREMRDNVTSKKFYTDLSDTVNTIFASSFSADDVEEQLEDADNYKKLEFDLYQFAEIATSEEFDVIAPLMANTMTLNAVSASSSGWAGLWRDIFGPTAGSYDPDNTRADFTVFYRAPNGESRPVETLAEIRLLKKGALKLDKVHLLQDGRKVGRDLKKSDFTDSELLAAMARSVQLAQERN